ncbi:MAG: glycosyltransferase [Gammaproteobacteria bacterium]|nr:glycosyltransferase [Gammaproteobacteria bacterium]
MIRASTFFSPAIELSPFDENEYIAARQKQRELYAIFPNKIWILFVASDYALKGLDRVLDAISIMDNEIHNTVVFSIIGDDNTSPYKTYIKKNHIKTRVDFLGSSDDVQLFMCGADLLLHPAKLELAGKVLLEALINRLPVCTTSVCGCSTYIVESQGGEVLPEPFSLIAFVETLKTILDIDALQNYKNKLTQYNINPSIYQSHQQLVTCIEKLAIPHNTDFYLDNYLMRYFPQEKHACINAVFSLKGKIFRQVKNRTTISTVIAEEEYFIKMHRGVGWREILKNITAFKSCCSRRQTRIQRYSGNEEIWDTRANCLRIRHRWHQSCQHTLIYCDKKKLTTNMT